MGLNARPLQLMALAMAGAVILTASSALAASSTVSPSRAGDGTGAISGFTVSQVHYQLGAAVPTNIISVSFVLSPEPSEGSTIKARLVTGGPWHSCFHSGGGDVTCPTLGVTAAAANELRVVAVQ